MADIFTTWVIEDIIPGEPLPGPVFLHLNHRFVAYRKEGDSIDRNTYDRMEAKGIRHFFVKQEERQKFEAWCEKGRQNVEPAALPVNKELRQAREDVRRSMMDIFHSSHPNEIVTKTLQTSQNLVQGIMKFPFAAQPLSQLQTFSRGTVDHSVNVSVLSVYLAMNLGYSHVLILRHIAAGGLLHDIGKAKVGLKDEDPAEVVEEKLKKHPGIATSLLDEEAVSKEVAMIIAQHHEAFDGSGYPKGLKGNQIYDLARIVSIANEFDNLVSTGQNALEERQKNAIEQLSGPLAHKFDPKKLEKVIRILELGI